MTNKGTKTKATRVRNPPPVEQTEQPLLRVLVAGNAARRHTGCTRKGVGGDVRTIGAVAAQ